jgi:cyclopropane fatty-acyl-phospholipid synthase-like methyltransferase
MPTADFLAKTKQKEPSKLLVEWVLGLGLEGGVALDLGCGAGAEAEFLAKNGFEVDAIDKSETAVKYTQERCQGLHVRAIHGNFLEFEMPPDRYTLVTSINALPFIGKEYAKTLLDAVKKSLKSGGVAILAVYGTEHAWNDRTDMSFWTMEEFKSLWDGFQIEHLKEYKGMSPLMSGEEIYQHRIHLVARKIS